MKTRKELAIERCPLVLPPFLASLIAARIRYGVGVSLAQRDLIDAVMAMPTAEETILKFAADISTKLLEHRDWLREHEEHSPAAAARRVGLEEAAGMIRGEAPSWTKENHE